MGRAFQGGLVKPEGLHLNLSPTFICKHLLIQTKNAAEKSIVTWSNSVFDHLVYPYTPKAVIHPFNLLFNLNWKRTKLGFERIIISEAQTLSV